MALIKPHYIEDVPSKSQKWDELTAGRDFKESDVPTLALLCQWYAIVDKCIEDLSFDGEIQVAYQNDLSDIKALPQVGMFKQASAEIRALNKQLGINDEAPAQGRHEVTPLHVVQENRKSKAARSRRAAAG